jgi:hypothetical protein
LVAIVMLVERTRSRDRENAAPPMESAAAGSVEPARATAASDGYRLESTTATIAAAPASNEALSKTWEEVSTSVGALFLQQARKVDDLAVLCRQWPAQLDAEWLRRRFALEELELSPSELAEIEALAGSYNANIRTLSDRFVDGVGRELEASWLRGSYRKAWKKLPPRDPHSPAALYTKSLTVDGWCVEACVIADEVPYLVALDAELRVAWTERDRLVREWLDTH